MTKKKRGAGREPAPKTTSRRKHNRVLITEGQFARFNALRASLSISPFDSKLKAERYLGDMAEDILASLLERLGAD